MTENRFVSIERIEVAGVPCLRTRPQGSTAALPTIINYHGWHSSKDNKRFESSILACHGFQVITPDALHHGERDPVDHDAPGALTNHFWEIILQSVGESTALINETIAKNDADPERIGVMGTSMGGFTASGVLVANAGIRCLVNISGACTWQEAELLFRRVDGQPLATDAQFAALVPYDAARHLDQLQQRPILMLHGDSDPLIPVELQRSFYKRAAEHYASCPEQLRLTEIPQLGHYTTTRMLEEAVGWLQQYV